jgi:multidrug resistance efflux pump
VKKGELLYSIDRKPLEAELAAAKADQQTAEADLSKGQQRREPATRRSSPNRP